MYLPEMVYCNVEERIIKRFIYSLAGIVVLGVAAFLIYQALSSSLVYFILPSDYAQNASEYADRHIRLAGIVEKGSVKQDDENLRLRFTISDGIESYPVSHFGAPPDLFKEGTGVVVEGKFEDDVFLSDNLLIKHSEVYEAPKDGEIDIEQLRESLQ